MFLFRSLAVAAAFLAAPAAVAQQAASAQAPADAFSEEQLRAFAAAVIELRALSDEYSPKLRSAQGDAAQSVRQEAMGKAVAVMQKHKLTPATFGQIMQAAQSNSALDQRITGYIEEMAGS
jgi:hypothetical protein